MNPHQRPKTHSPSTTELSRQSTTPTGFQESSSVHLPSKRQSKTRIRLTRMYTTKPHPRTNPSSTRLVKFIAVMAPRKRWRRPRLGKRRLSRLRWTPLAQTTCHSLRSSPQQRIHLTSIPRASTFTRWMPSSTSIRSWSPIRSQSMSSP